MSEWYIYILRCNDNTLYTGIATDVERRFSEHKLRSRKCSKYCRARTPLEIVYKRKAGTLSTALKIEKKIKKLSKAAKEKIIKNNFPVEKLL